jgi:hypothetical protein
MLAMLTRLTLQKTKNKKSYFRGSVVLHTVEHAFYFSFLEVMAGPARLTWTLRRCTE